MSEFIKRYRNPDDKVFDRHNLQHYANILNLIASCCDTAQFMRKYHVYGFEFYTKFVGSYALSKFLIISWIKSPVMHCFFGNTPKPKDFFIFFASCIETYIGGKKEWDVLGSMKYVKCR